AELLCITANSGLDFLSRHWPLPSAQPVRARSRHFGYSVSSLIYNQKFKFAKRSPSGVVGAKNIERFFWVGSPRHLQQGDHKGNPRSFRIVLITLRTSLASTAASNSWSNLFGTEPSAALSDGAEVFRHAEVFFHAWITRASATC